MVPINRLRSPWHSRCQRQHHYHQHHATASKSSSPRPSLDKTLPPPPNVAASQSTSRSTSEPTLSSITTVLIGAKQQPFSVNCQLLCEASPFFSERLLENSQPKSVCLWLPGESSTMFALFVHWVHAPGSFRQFLDHSIASAHNTGEQAAQDIHWAIIRLHLFASHLDLHKLQDLAMDAIQDMYLKYDWDVPPSLITYLYTQCESLPAVRVRRWAVAMVAFSQTVGSSIANLKFHPQDSATSDPARFRALFDSLPDFAADYATHVRNMKAARLDIRSKNPQLRISANKLRNDERLFGFRECSFHSHRAAIGERRCPHSRGRSRSKHPDMGLRLRDSYTGVRELIPEPLFTSGRREEARLKHARPISSEMREG
ncbi:hypothetical protein X797_003901 [Metarhizium robertsii]|uniref:BTB domain-containing protein n=2 Tax=Metarhizium robertsii TaxID=568076 RepID=E9EVN8_METRA|nr:uncharacterized protein MAA_04087 [Metarhizium robertsii ARSEF 23]EFZ00310.2 hypothetical protein MAA_04087 [Metarhizium robertsii ARSEF 23]EXV02779.1 hypothetical protein X797_003901 [Metarhizium robertsii]